MAYSPPLRDTCVCRARLFLGENINWQNTSRAGGSPREFRKLPSDEDAAVGKFREPTK